MSSEVLLECKLAREYTLENIAGSLSYLIVKSMPDPAISFSLLPLNLSIVIDVSASMKGNKIKYAKEASSYIIDSLSPDDNVSVVIFSDAAKTIVPSTKVTDKDAIIKAISKIGPVSGTRMYYGIEKAIDEMNKVTDRDNINIMILLTDGETDGEDICLDIVRRERDKGIAISTFGIGETYNELLLKSISDVTLGKIYHLQSAEMIKEYFENEVSTARATVITNTSLTLILENDVKLDDIHRILPSTARLDPQTGANRGSYTVNLNNLRMNEATYVGVKMILPARANGENIGGLIYFKYDVPTFGTYGNSRECRFNVNYTNDRSLCNNINREVISYFNQLDVENLIDKAINETKAGNISEATKVFSQAQMLTQKIGNSALTQNINRATVELNEHGKISADAIKTMRVGASHTVKLDDNLSM
ncbi:MAG: VWA domain-containing protein [Dehalococcoidia bacterium]